MNITSYAYNAAVHCPRCAEKFAEYKGETLERFCSDYANECHPVFNEDGYCDTCGAAYGNAPPVCRILSIDAWREPDGGWTWNNWFYRGHVPLSLCGLPKRALFRELRKLDFTIPAGKCDVEDDGYNLVITYGSARQPILALEYGAVE